jgi:hypothetical protein
MSVIGNRLYSMPVTNVYNQMIYKCYFSLFYIHWSIIKSQLYIVLFIHLRSYNICAHTNIIVHLYLNYTNKMSIFTMKLITFC